MLINANTMIKNNLCLALLLSTQFNGGLAVEVVPCTTLEQCKARYTTMRKAGVIKGYFYSSSDYLTKGCVIKGENYFFGDGGTIEQMSEEDLSGIQQRVWCMASPSDAPSLAPSSEGSDRMSMSMSLPSMSMSMSLPSLTELEMSLPTDSTKGKASKAVPLGSLPLTELDMSMSLPLLTELEMLLPIESMSMSFNGKASKETPPGKKPKQQRKLRRSKLMQ